MVAIKFFDELLAKFILALQCTCQTQQGSLPLKIGFNSPQSKCQIPVLAR